MKLHLEQKITLSNTPPKINPIKNENLFIYYSDNFVVICDLLTCKIYHKFRYEDVQVLKIHKNHLYICTNEIYVLDLEKFEIIDVIKLSKALINFISFYNDSFIVSKIDNKISYYSGKRKLFEVLNDVFVENLFIGEEYCGFFDTNKAVVYSTKGLKILEYENESIIAIHSIFNKVFLLLNSGSLIELISGNRIEINLEIENAYFSDEFISAISSNKLLTLSYSGSILDSIDISKKIEEYSGLICDNFTCIREILKNQNLKPQNIKRLKSNNHDDSENADSRSITSDSDSYDSNCINLDINPNNSNGIDSSNSNTDSEIDPSENFNSYSFDNESENSDSKINSEDIKSRNSDLVEIENNIDSNNDQNSIDIEAYEISFSILSNNFIKTSENDIIFLNSNRDILKIISFVDDCTDSISYENFLLVSTSSGFLKYCDISKYASGNFVFDSKLIKLHASAITCMKIYKNFIITSSNDLTIAFFKLETTNSILKFTKIYEMSGFNSLITSFVFQNNLLAIATRDCLLQIYQNSGDLTSGINLTEMNMNDLNINIDQESFSYSFFFNSFENISTQRIHQKPINHLSITSKFIITSSNDKTSKILDFNGTTVKTISSDKVLCSSFDSKYIAICSQKGAKIFHLNSLSPITSFQSKRPILASCFYKGYFLVVSDILRIYDIDKKKCVKSYDIAMTNCWCFNFPIACGENKIIVFEDVSIEIYNKLLEKARNIKEDSILFEKFILEKNFEKALDVALNGKQENLIYKVISTGINSDPNLDFLKNFMKNGEIKSRIFDLLIKNSGFKASMILNKITFLFADTKIDKKKKTKLLEIISKHVDAIDDIYIELMGLELFKK